jgi:acyl transferase domain-containing protein
MDMTENVKLDVAIIGIAGRFPGAKTIEQFWQNIKDGVESIHFFHPDELAFSYIDAVHKDQPNYVRARGILKNIAEFDANFFEINPREAEIMDPQHRIFLECAWEALENSGYVPSKFSGAIGVVAGSYHNTYLLNNLYSNRSLLDLMGGDVIMHGNAHDHLATHVAYKLNLNGPAFTIQTACSSSLVAVHLACQQLLTGESDMVLAGGVCIAVPEESGYLYQKGGILSPDGHCRAFDAKAEGTVFGNGVGIVVLRRLEDALTNGDHIYAVIRGSAINNDGALKAGYMAPSIEGQATVIAQALTVSGVEPESIAYIEAHGTGTVMGDNIEMTALHAVYNNTQQRNFCGIGSVKPNIGHLQAASGIAGLIKTTLALQHKILPPSIHCETPNTHIDFINSPFYINTTCAMWPAKNLPRRAGVSSFGVGGTNAHVILEEAPLTTANGQDKSHHLLLLSAKTSHALEEATTNLNTYLEKSPRITLADVAYTLQTGRETFNYRRFIVCQTTLETAQYATMTEEKNVFSHHQTDTKLTKTIFLFPGQGSQYVNMAYDLYQEESSFRDCINHCATLLEPHLKLNLIDFLYPEANQFEKAKQALQQTALAQPALFVIEYALAKLWMSWGIQADIMIGHSIGEYVAACLAGVMSLEDALQLVSVRGQLMQAQAPGAMLAVNGSGADIKSLLDDTLCVAAINTAHTCVISGPVGAIQSLQTRLESKNITNQLVPTSHAFHSSMMDSMLNTFASHVKNIRLQTPKSNFVSNVSGTMILPTEARDPNYWVKHLRATVLFGDSIEHLITEQSSDTRLIFLEVGPSHTLTSFVQTYVSSTGLHQAYASLRHPKIQKNDLAFILTTLGNLWLQNLTINWDGFYSQQTRSRIPLPTYPFQRQTYWITADHESPSVGMQKMQGKNPNLLDWFYLPSWKQLPLSCMQNRFTDVTKKWLIFIEKETFSIEVTNFLKNQKQQVITVATSSRYVKLDPEQYCINPTNSQDFHVLIQSLQQDNQLPDKIIYFCTIPLAVNAQLTSYTDFNHLLFLAQALGKQSHIQATDIYIVTQNMQEIIGYDLLHPEQAVVLGPCRVIPQEYPNIHCTCIDIAATDIQKTDSTFFNALMLEFFMDPIESVVAYRGKQRWVQTFEPWKVNSITTEVSLLRKQGVYLITGGLGGIGLTLATYLAQHWQANLILIGRADFPARSEWSNWLEQHDSTNVISQKIKTLQLLESYGTKIITFSADVTQEQDMQTVIQQATSVFGPIHGVIHAAGIAGGGLIQTKTDTNAATVMHSKIQGSLVLNKLFNHSQLDFMLLCSSISAILNTVGQIDYCAANAYLDAFAHYRTIQTGQYTISINWDTWQDIGMAVNTMVPAVLRDIRKHSIEQGILPQEASEIFHYLLSTRLPQIIISTQDLSIIIQQHKQTTVTTLLDANSETPVVTTSHERPSLKTTYLAPDSEIETQLVILWEELLGIKGIGVEDNFFDLGGHSLLGSQVLARCRETFGVELSLDAIFNQPTIADLAIAVEDKILEEVEA